MGEFTHRSQFEQAVPADAEAFAAEASHDSEPVNGYVQHFDPKHLDTPYWTTIVHNRTRTTGILVANDPTEPSAGSMFAWVESDNPELLDAAGLPNNVVASVRLTHSCDDRGWHHIVHIETLPQYQREGVLLAQFFTNNVTDPNTQIIASTPIPAGDKLPGIDTFIDSNRDTLSQLLAS